MSFADNKIFWESFILLYQSMPCLWNVRTKEYANKQMRNDAYGVLVKKCKEIYPEADVKFVRKKIDSLRAGFRRELREIKKSIKSGDEPIYEPNLWYFSLLLFTQDQEEARPDTSSVASEESGTEEDQNDVSHFLCVDM